MGADVPILGALVTLFDVADWQLSQRHHGAFLAVAFSSFQFCDKKATLKIL